MFSLRSSVLRVMVLVAAIVAIAGSAQAGDVARPQQRSRHLQAGTSAPTVLDGADVLTMSPTPSAATEAPTAAPSSAERDLETEAPTTSGVASLSASAAIFVGTVAAAMTLA